MRGSAFLRSLAVSRCGCKKGAGESARFYVVENNATGQLAQLIRQELLRAPDGLLLKYDGRPFYPVEIANKIKELAR